MRRRDILIVQAMFRRAAVSVDLIPNSEDPATLPVDLFNTCWGNNANSIAACLPPP